MEEELLKRIEKLEEQVRSLTTNEVLQQIGVFVSGTPTNNGYITIMVNGRRYKIATVS